MIRALAIAVALAGCGVKAPPRPPLPPGAAPSDAAARPESPEQASAGRCAAPPSRESAQ